MSQLQLLSWVLAGFHVAPLFCSPQHSCCHLHIISCQSPSVEGTIRTLLWHSGAMRTRAPQWNLGHFPHVLRCRVSHRGHCQKTRLKKTSHFHCMWKMHRGVFTLLISKILCREQCTDARSSIYSLPSLMNNTALVCQVWDRVWNGSTFNYSL